MSTFAKQGATLHGSNCLSTDPSPPFLPSPSLLFFLGSFLCSFLFSFSPPSNGQNRWIDVLSGYVVTGGLIKSINYHF